MRKNVECFVNSRQVLASALIQQTLTAAVLGSGLINVAPCYWLKSPANKNSMT